MKIYKSTLCLLGIAAGMLLLAHSSAEMGTFVRAELWRIVENEPSDNDNDGDRFANYHDIEPEVWSNYFGTSVYKGWNLNDRMAAFDWYLNSISTNDSQRIDGEELLMFRVAIAQCQRSFYTNAVPALKKLVMNPRGVEKNVALRFIVDCSPISDSLTDFIESIMTNKVVYRRQDRGAACRAYADKVRQTVSEDDEQNRIRRRAAWMFYRNRMVDAAGAYYMDKLFADQYSGYEISSNRLEYISFVLTNPLLKDSSYFNSITNQLLSSGQPLQWINIGGTNE